MKPAARRYDGLEQLRPGRFRIVRIIARLNVGGPAQHVLHLTRGLGDRHPTLLVTGDVDDGEMEMDFDATDIDVCRIPELGRRVRLSQDFAAFLKIVRILRAVRPMIVHTHTAKAGSLGRLAAVVARVPIRVHTFHGHVFDGYFSPLMSRVVVAIERALGWLTTRVIAIGEQQAFDLTDRYRVCRRQRVSVVPLGLELDRFSLTDRARQRQEFRMEIGAHGRFVIAAIGRLVPIKNHELLLRAAALLARERRDFLVIVVGDGTERGRLETLTDGLGLTQQVKFLGWRSDLQRIYAGSDLVVLSSRNEGTPVCLIEALAAGVPVVATDVGGVRDVIRHGHTGVLVGSDDRGELARTIRRLLDDEHTRQRLGRAGTRWAPERFSVARLLAEMSTVYERELARFGPAAVAPAHASVAAADRAASANPTVTAE